MTPFAEGTISLVAELSYGLSRENAVYLRKYLQDEPIVAYQEHWNRLRPVLRGIATYSLALVTVSKSNLDEDEKLEQLATFLDRMFRPVVSAPVHDFPMTAGELDRILADIQSQGTLLDGLGSAQPIVDDVALYAGTYLDTIKAAEQEAADWLVERITVDNADVIAFADEIREAQARGFRSLMLINDYRDVLDPQIIEQMRTNDPQLSYLIPQTTQLTLEELQAIEDRVLYRLRELRSLKEQIAADIESYQLMIREMDVLVRAASDNLVRARATIWVWSRAHARLAEGVTDPARLDLMGIARQALNAAAPLF